MKVAIVHDWLTGMRGGEKVLEILCDLFPQAEIFTLVYNKGRLSSFIESRPIHTSFLQKLPYVGINYRNYLPLFPLAVESFDLREFDLVISSSHCVAKGVKKPKNAYHICYCYTPMRYIWFFFNEYFGSYPFFKKNVIRLVSRYLKRWDLSTVKRVDDFVAISDTVKKRIKDVYNREATIIYPPVDTDKFYLDYHKPREDFYLCVSALVPYKRIDIIVDAFNEMRDKKLFIVGEGSLKKDLEKKAFSSHIKFLGWQKEEVLIDLYQRATAFVYAAEEDFGIAPLEAQATGLPVVGYGKGGLLETVIPLNGESKETQPTGIFFIKQDKSSLIDAVNEFEKKRKYFSPQHIRNNALRFSEISFKKSIKKFIENKLNQL
jgi:glycosyltransferase involved in cell wall biosynthesis